jgi:reticulon-4-interacting protein 1, mitochondrial
MAQNSAKVKSWVHTAAGYPQTLEFREIDVPAAPAPGHILIQLRAAALNPVDIQFMNIPLNSLPYLNGPKIPGRDFAGTVLAGGEGTDFKKGDNIFGISMAFNGTGSLTEVADIDLKAGATFIRKPGTMSWVQAASLPLVYLTARTMIEKFKPGMKASDPSENKLVILGGSSATGIYTVKIARSLGWTVLATCSARNAQFVRDLGASQVVDYTASPTAVVDAVKKFSPQAIADCVGGTECIGLAPHFVTIVGDKTSRADMGGPPAYLTHPRMILRWLLGCLGVGNAYECISLDPRKEWLQETTMLEPEGDIVIDSVFEFEKVQEAFERLNTGRARGKVVVEFKSS